MPQVKQLKREKMRQIISQIGKLTELLEREIEKREEIFDKRSEKWQESEKGEDFQEKTQRLEEMLDDASEWFHELMD